MCGKPGFPVKLKEYVGNRFYFKPVTLLDLEAMYKCHLLNAPWAFFICEVEVHTSIKTLTLSHPV